MNNKEFAKTKHKERFAPASNSVSDMVRANLAPMIYDLDPEATTNFKKETVSGSFLLGSLYSDPFRRKMLKSNQRIQNTGLQTDQQQ